MRELTDVELQAIYGDRRCPFCSFPFEHFFQGPRGGMSRNMQCAGCLAIVNVIAPDYWSRWPNARIGQLIEGPRRPLS